MEVFTPIERYYSKILSRRSTSHKKINPFRKSDIFDFSTSVQLSSFIRKLFALLEQAEELRIDASKNPFFDIKEAF
jgi:hypothetical protein